MLPAKTNERNVKRPGKESRYEEAREMASIASVNKLDPFPVASFTRCRSFDFDERNVIFNDFAVNKINRRINSS